jgi:hypothetical protein
MVNDAKKKILIFQETNLYRPTLLQSACLMKAGRKNEFRTAIYNGSYRERFNSKL